MASKKTSKKATTKVAKPAVAASPAVASPDPTAASGAESTLPEAKKDSGGDSLNQGKKDESSEASDLVLQLREKACERWARKQGWGPTETGKLVNSVPALVSRGWVWQNTDGSREFLESDIPEDTAEFEEAVATVKLSKQDHHQFLWNERLAGV